MLQPMTLEGSHVRLEPLRLDHVPALVAAATGPRDTFVFTPVPSDELSAMRYVESALAEQAAGRALPFATIDRRAGRVVGSTRYFDIQLWNWADGSPYQRGNDLPDGVEIGYTWLSPDAQRTAINTEAKFLMLTHAFETWQVHRVRLHTDARNHRSRTAIERLGARLDGVLRADKIAYDGAIRDSAFYSILDSEWPAVKGNLQKRLLRP